MFRNRLRVKALKYGYCITATEAPQFSVTLMCNSLVNLIKPWPSEFACLPRITIVYNSNDNRYLFTMTLHNPGFIPPCLNIRKLCSEG